MGRLLSTFHLHGHTLGCYDQQIQMLELTTLYSITNRTAW